MPTEDNKYPALDIIFNPEDLPFEEEILRNPFSVKHWLRYIEHKKSGPKHAVNIIFERALKELPGSYKLWYNYLCFRRHQIKGRCITDPCYEELINIFERALVFMHKMPRIWLDYCKFLVDLQKITATRKVFDAALRALPVTQHARIWPLYLDFVRMHPIPETAVRVFRRYLKLFPDDAEEYIQYLRSINRLDEAAVRLTKLVNSDHFVSKEGKSSHQLWNELCELISQNPHEIKTLNVDAIIRGGLRRYTDQIGHLWCSLADYYIRGGLFEKARDIYEEAIQTVNTVRDFTQIFDAYAQFEELNLSKRMEEVAASGGPTEDDDVEVELLLARFEELMDRRPLLLNSVLLRQNPHNVAEWHKRVQLYEGQPHAIIETYTEAVQRVDPKLALGKPHTLWVGFAKFYESHKQLADARLIFERATQQPFVKVDDLAAIWCEWAEMEIRHENYKEALRLMQKSTTPPSHSRVSYHDESETVQARLFKSLRLWSLYADLEESFGTFRTCKAVYDRIIDLKIATPQIIMNYALFLEEQNYFEDGFQAYEKGIALFKWPHVYDLWNTYLTKFLARYGGAKLERARDLLEQCLEHCPPEFCRHFYLLYAKLEEEHGLTRHALAVYDRATQAVEKDHQFEMFNLYIKKAAEMHGLTHTRPIYEKAIEALSEAQAREMCLRFAELERKLGEIDRARAIYAHCSQMCDPRMTETFWNTWREFEVRHGNEDTMREMLRIKRSVQALYNTQVNMMSAQMMGVTPGGGVSSEGADTMQRLEAEVMAREGEGATGAPPPAKVPRTDKNIMFVRSETQPPDTATTQEVSNPAEIDIDMDDEEEEEEGNENDEEGKKEAKRIKIETKQVPTQVFGGLVKEDDEDE